MITINEQEYKKYFDSLLSGLPIEIKKSRGLTCEQLSGAMEEWCRKNYRLNDLKNQKQYRDDMRRLLNWALDETKFDF